MGHCRLHSVYCKQAMTRCRQQLTHCRQAMVMCQPAMVIAGLQRSLQVNNYVNANRIGSLQVVNRLLQVCCSSLQKNNEQLQVNYDATTTGITSLQPNNALYSTNNAFFLLLFPHASFTIWH
jgi:hypothetical protein